MRNTCERYLFPGMISLFSQCVLLGDDSLSFLPLSPSLSHYSPPSLSHYSLPPPLSLPLSRSTLSLSSLPLLSRSLSLSISTVWGVPTAKPRMRRTVSAHFLVLARTVLPYSVVLKYYSTFQRVIRNTDHSTSQLFASNSMQGNTQKVADTTTALDAK